ncbi:FadR/GntR family transcriptional regulator [Gordonia westfalica]|uniref:FadR/GntR family transcriptional regulator n=1 Tax=Gordonia westfalica TaxID=158898 RepID=UPI001FCBBAF8|nr:FCD domain-containing protein [Gordonia westfalica]
MSADESDPGPPDIPAYAPEMWRRPISLPGTVSIGLSRAEQAANQIARLAAGAPSGSRIGSKDDIRQICGVSVGTVNEAIKLAQERGVITSRPGPGGGIFAANPSPLARMNGWFRSAPADSAALGESIQIRDAIAPVLVAEALGVLTDEDISVMRKRVAHMRRTLDEQDLSAFVWAAWRVHEYLAGVGNSQLLNSLYLSIMDVGTSHLRAQLDAADTQVPVYPDRLAEVVDDLVDALTDRDADRAIDALRRTDPTIILRAPSAADA